MTSHPRKYRRRERHVQIRQNRNQKKTLRSERLFRYGLLAGVLVVALSFGSAWIAGDAVTAESVVIAESIEADDGHFAPESRELTVGKGDTLMEMLTDTGVTYGEAHEAVAALKEFYDPRRLNSGKSFTVKLEADDEDPTAPSLAELTLPISSIATVELTREEDGDFAAKKIEVPVTASSIYQKESINGSLYVTGRKMGLSPAMLAELIKALSYDVDFQRDIKKGHQFEAVFERLTTEDGRVVGSQNLVFASLEMGKKKVDVYRHTDNRGHTDYYDAKGQSLRKALLKTPINGARISSRFGMRRHPILGYSKMHTGMDFAARRGTPIYAAGDGVVKMAGRRGGYGKYVRIRHNGTYSTAYAHASRIAKGIRPGARVKQGQVIAYVGTTGRSTGPHLHYELLRRGKQINPKGVKFKTGRSLAGKELKRFKTATMATVAMAKKQAKQPAKVVASVR